MNVLVLLPLTEAQRATLESGAPDADYTYATKLDVTDEQIAAAEVIVGNLDPARLPAARSLRLLQLNSAGYDKYSAPGTVPEGAALTCAVGAYGQAVSEHMFAMILAMMKHLDGYRDDGRGHLFAMILAMMKHLDGYRDDGRGHLWTDRGQVTTFEGAQVLVLGAGDIGTHFAKLAGSFGAHVTGVRRRVGEVPEGFDAIRSMDDLPELLPAADVVVSFLPSSPATRGLADAAFFARCKPGSYFANGGRGDLVVQADLIAALESGQIAGAALDVTTPEPLPADDPLWDAPNIFITPHVAGQFHLPAVLTNIAAITADNLTRLQACEPLRNLVEL